MNRLCRLGLHAWRFTDWENGDIDGCGDACARPGCRRIRGSADQLKVSLIIRAHQRGDHRTYPANHCPMCRNVKALAVRRAAREVGRG